jgi:hypothetical protein
MVAFPAWLFVAIGNQGCYRCAQSWNSYAGYAMLASPAGVALLVLGLVAPGSLRRRA